jgi:integrase
MSDSSFQNVSRRLSVPGCPGLWTRRKADGSFVFELKLRQGGVLASTTLPVGTTESQARTAWKKTSASRDEGGRPLARDVRLSVVAAEALADLDAKAAAGLRSKRTHASYVTNWELHLKPPLGNKRLARITPQDVLRLVASLRLQGLAEWTASAVITTLRTILRFARHAGYMSADPFASLSPDDLPRQQARETFVPRVLRVAEIERLIGSTTDAYRKAVIVLAYTGLRLSELAGLVWADVDLVDRVIHVRKQLAPLKRGEEPARVKPKSRASVRDVPLVDRAYEALVEQLRSEQARGLGADGDFVFTSETGRPVGRTGSRSAASAERPRRPDSDRLGHRYCGAPSPRQQPTRRCRS